MTTARDRFGDFVLTDEPGPAPEPSYSCATPGCAEHCTYPADMLQWWDGVTISGFNAEDEQVPLEQGTADAGWYCDSCVEHMNAITGPTLHQHLQDQEVQE